MYQNRSNLMSPSSVVVVLLSDDEHPDTDDNNFVDRCQNARATAITHLSSTTVPATPQ